MIIDPPLALLAELTHRCPLRCPYCSNPVELERRLAEMATADWLRVLDQAAALGVLQVHFSGGEPLLRPDLPVLVGRARELGLYSNLITSGLGLSAALADILAAAGLDHVQISIQDAEAGPADEMAGLKGAHGRKLEAARAARQAGLPLTVNAVVHRRNLGRLADMVALAKDLGAQRLEVAHVQYHGWALVNRAALMPTPGQVASADAVVERAREAMAVDHVPPDYLARRPKACLGGWGRQSLVVTPSGTVLPCHAAQTIPGLAFHNAREHPLEWIWRHGDAFRCFRGTEWMPEPCRSCDQREVDWGGCRCQALALTGDAVNPDPVCDRSPAHGTVRAAAALAEGGGEAAWLVYRGGAPGEPVGPRTYQGPH